MRGARSAGALRRRRRRPDRTRLVAEFSRDKGGAVEDLAERPGAGRHHYPRNQQIAATSEAAPDNDSFEVEDLQGHGARAPEGGTGAIDEIQSEVVAPARGVEYCGRVKKVGLLE